MAYESTQLLVSGKASADLSAKQYYAVKFDTTTAESGISLATAAKNIDGILQDKPTSGMAGAVCIFGITKAAISASQTITSGQLLEVGSGSTLVPIASGTAIAKALEPLTSNAAVCLVTVLLLKSAAVYS